MADKFKSLQQNLCFLLLHFQKKIPHIKYLKKNVTSVTWYLGKGAEMLWIN